MTFAGDHPLRAGILFRLLTHWEKVLGSVLGILRTLEEAWSWRTSFLPRLAGGGSELML